MSIGHLYDGNEHGDESTSVTSYSMRQCGRKGRPGTGQIGTVALAVLVAGLDFWRQRLIAHGFVPCIIERFGEKMLGSARPCGIAYEWVGTADDVPLAYSNDKVPAELAIRGTHTITVCAREPQPSLLLIAPQQAAFGERVATLLAARSVRVL